MIDQERIDKVILWAGQQGCTLQREGEVGFGRECVGITHGTGYVDTHGSGGNYYPDQYWGNFSCGHKGIVPYELEPAGYGGFKPPRRDQEQVVPCPKCTAEQFAEIGRLVPPALGAANAPDNVVNAYHKHDCLCVLGRGDEALEELLAWVERIIARGGTVEVGERQFEPGTDNPISRMLHGDTQARIVFPPMVTSDANA